MSKTDSGKNARQDIIKSATKLLLEEGVTKLTLDAVAKKAGVSKGGLLYHFPGKDDLIRGLIDNLNESFDADVARQIAEANDNTPGYWLRAYIQASAEAEPEFNENSAALLAGIALNSDLLEPFRRSFGEFQDKSVSDGIDPVVGTIIRLAVDGLWLAELFKLAPPDPELRQQVIERLMAMTKEA
jgi:AcrR family transcriptional regulator